MPLLAALAARLKLPEWVVVLVASLALLGLVAALAGLWLADVKRDAIREDRAKVAVDVLKGDVKANEKAAETRREDDARLSTEARELEKVTNDAKDDPAAARQRYYACVRVQQDARTRGIPSPSCGS